MGDYTITRRVRFDAGHRVLRHESKCAHLHGHGYTALVTVRAPELDSLGRVIDFGCLKQVIQGWVDAYWDHNMILHPDDPLSNLYRLAAHGDNPTKSDVGGIFQGVFGGKAPYMMPENTNPTAENLAHELYFQVQPLLPKEIAITRVRLYETPNCYADFYPSQKFPLRS